MVQSLDRGIEILEYLSENKLANCTEIAQHLEINKSSAFRLVSTLVNRNYVKKDQKTSQYSLGIAVLRLSEAFLENTDRLDIARPIIQEMVSEVHFGAHLCMLLNNQAVIVMDVKSEERINVSAKIGAVEPIYCSSVGKCLLAFTNDSNQAELLNRIEYVKYTDKTILKKTDILKEIKDIQKKGFATDNEELSYGIRCVAAPIKNYRGEVIYSLGLSGTVQNILEDDFDKYGEIIMSHANQISEKLGYVK